MVRELRNLAYAIFLGFTLIALSSTYWSVFQQEGLLRRNDNPRRVFAERNFARGLIVDRSGIALAVTSPRAGTAYPQRNYPYSYVVGATGYYSYQYGASGLELAFNNVLLGQLSQQPQLWQRWQGRLLHRAPVGYDLRTTIDLWLQQHLAKRFDTQHGAAVVIELPSGAIRAMVSLPAVDPNTLDLNWPYLQTQTQQSPLVNRVLNFTYQPGGALQPLLLMAMLNDGYQLDQSISLSSPIQIDGFMVTCLQEPVLPVTLQRAVIAGCPDPFATYTNLEMSLFEQAGFFEPVPLYRMAVIPRRPSEPYNLYLEALGQGQLTIAPLQMARVVVAFANDGYVPDFYMADAYRIPHERVWRPLSIPRHEWALFPTEWVIPIRAVMAEEATTMPFNAGQFGHVGVAYAGEQMLSWYVGFSTFDDGLTWVVVVVIENAQAPYDAVVVAQGAFEYAAILAE